MSLASQRGLSRLSEVERVRICDSKVLKQVPDLMKVSKRRMAGWKKLHNQELCNLIIKTMFLFMFFSFKTLG
jgi:hypothetical protein